jgi:hypothetical protein
MRGHDEECVQGTDTITAIQLLDRLLVTGEGNHTASIRAIDLIAADRDRLLAQVYMRTYGHRLESTVQCSHCGEPFDLEFSLQELLDSLQAEARTMDIQEEPGGIYRMPDGRRFRLPTGEDECAVWHLPAEETERELMARCLVEGDMVAEPEVVQQAMQEVAPVLDLDLGARCPTCEETQSVHFDIQAYLLTALMSEREHTAQQVHLLASAYAWTLQEILSLSRSQRRRYAALIRAEYSAPREGYE